MIRHLKVRYNRITILLNLHILAVILTDRYAWVNNIRNDHHDLLNLLCQLRFLCLQLFQTRGDLCNLSLSLLSLLLLALCHQTTDLFGDLLATCAKLISLLLCLSRLCIECDHLIHKWKLVLLKLIFDVLFYDVRIFSDKFQV